MLASAFIIISTSSFASNITDNITPFVGIDIGITNNFYDHDIAEKYGIPYSTLYSKLFQSFTYGINIGTSFLDDTHIYHPGIQLFYNRINDTAILNVATGYGNVEFVVDATYNLSGIEFDNYIRITHNKRDIFGTKCDSFLVLGLDIGKIKSTYKLADFSSVKIHEDGTFYGAKLEGISQYRNGIGFSVSFKLLKADIEALPYMTMTHIGIRYTF